MAAISAQPVCAWCDTFCASVKPWWQKNSQSVELETGVTMLDTAPPMRDSAFQGRGVEFERRLDTNFERGESTAGAGMVGSAGSLLSEKAEELSVVDWVETDALDAASVFSSVLKGSAPRLGTERPFSLLLGDDGVRGWLASCFVCCGGVCGSSCSTIGSSPPKGEESRLGGGELSPDLASGESPGRRFGQRRSISELLELQLAFEDERASVGCVVRSAFGDSPRTLCVSDDATGVRVEPRFTPLAEASVRSLATREELGVEWCTSSATTVTSIVVFLPRGPLRGCPTASPCLVVVLLDWTTRAGVSGRRARDSSVDSA